MRYISITAAAIIPIYNPIIKAYLARAIDMAIEMVQELEILNRRSDGACPSNIGLDVGPERDQADWKPGKQEFAVMLTLAFISLMVALDATILVSVLPVRDLRQDGINLMLIV